MTFEGSRCPICHGKKSLPIKSIGIGITLVTIIVTVGFLFMNGIIELNQEDIEKSIPDIPQKLPEINIPVPDLPALENITQIIPKIQEQAKQIMKPELDIQKIELLIHEKINNQREQQGLTLLEFDSQISDIARTHSQDMAQNNYFEHTSLNGKEPWNRGEPYGYTTCGTNDAVSLQKKYDELSIQYDEYPQVSTNESQYQEAMSLYNQLNSISVQLNSLSENNQLFGGLAENIAQNWTYESITYINGIPNYNWNTEEDLAEQTVDGWMNSSGHRKNILSGFHSEGIGVAIASDDKVYVTQNFC
jgi:uncharacterized protein YkwD